MFLWMEKIHRHIDIGLRAWPCTPRRRSEAAPHAKPSQTLTQPKRTHCSKLMQYECNEPGRCLVRTIVGSSSSSVYTYSTPERGCFAAKYTIAWCMISGYQYYYYILYIGRVRISSGADMMMFGY